MSDPPDSAWLDALLGGTDGVEIPPQSQGVGSIALSQMYRDAAMLEQESLALSAESPRCMRHDSRQRVRELLAER